MKEGISILTKTRDWAGTKGDGRRVESEGSPPGIVLGDRVLDKGTTGSTNMWFDRRDVFAFPGAEGRKGEGLCPYSDRRRWIVNKVFKVGFRHGRKIRIVSSPSNEGNGAGFDLAEKSGRRLGFSKVNGEAVEVEEGFLEGVDVVLVVDVRVQVCGPFQGSGGRPGGGKVDQGEGNAVDVEGRSKELVEFLDGERAIERSGKGLLGGHCGLRERDAHQHHLDQQWTVS
jgi:hypothetical protein